MDHATEKTLKVLHITAECAPFSKVGGLADVAGSLPPALARLGVDARILTPSWPGVPESLRDLGKPVIPLPRDVAASLDWKVVRGTLSRTETDEAPVYLLDHPELFSNRKIYPDKLDVASFEPFEFLSLAGLDLGNATGWTPDVIHVHDWPTCMLPAALKWRRHSRNLNSRYATVLTIHNLAHQGILPGHALDSLGFPYGAFTIESLEFYGDLNMLKGGIIASDAVTTVSPTYAHEIRTRQYGERLEGVLEANAHKVKGVINGLDQNYWNPATDEHLPAAYDANNPEGKHACRKALLDHAGWDDDGSPLFASVGRLATQKGLDILLEALPSILKDGRLVIIGSGDPVIESALKEAQAEFPNKIHARIGFDEPLAHLAYAGADMFLMPSLFEPCGLSQMIAMRYGTVPVVRSTGGLVDTVPDAERGDGGLGFTFTRYAASDLEGAARRARSMFRRPEAWAQLVQRCMRTDFSWARSAETYREIYEGISKS